MTPAMYCTHANEMPQSCPCDAECFCRVEGACRSRTTPPLDKCQFCLGAKGGVAGNENVIHGVIVCDHCHVLLGRATLKHPATLAPGYDGDEARAAARNPRSVLKEEPTKPLTFCGVCGGRHNLGYHGCDPTLPGNGAADKFKLFVQQVQKTQESNHSVPSAPSVQRIRYESRPGFMQFGVFLGLYVDERSDVQAVIRLDAYGLMLHVVHPSKVIPTTPDEEESYK